MWRFLPVPIFQSPANTIAVAPTVEMVEHAACKKESHLDPRTARGGHTLFSLSVYHADAQRVRNDPRIVVNTPLRKEGTRDGDDKLDGWSERDRRIAVYSVRYLTT